MGFDKLDWALIAVYFVITLSCGLAFSRRASKGTDEFFLAGRKLPWWLAGASMVATMFASDTPLFHCGNVREGGISVGWIFIYPMFGAILAATVFAPLVRRSRVVTDAEFIELRYSGGAPSLFRAFVALYNGVFYASCIMIWVTKGMHVMVVEVMEIPVDYEVWVVVGLLGVVTLYSMAAGLWGVVTTDIFQYLVAAVGSILLAIFALNACGGLDGLRDGLAAIPGHSGADLHLWPTSQEKAMSTGESMMPISLIVGWILVHGCNLASSTQHQGQRILACRSERDASLTYVFYSFCYYILNGVPWILIGLCSLVVLGYGPDVLEKPSHAFPAMIRELMPAGLKGLMIAAMFAAFMSTVSVILNWGSSYIVNDLYRRFLARNRGETHYIWGARLASLAIAVIGGTLSFQFDGLTQIMLSVPVLLNGVFVIFLLRMLWWRSNIWGEISGYVASPVIGFYIEFIVTGKIAWLSYLPGHGAFAVPEGQEGWQFFGWKLMLVMAATALVSIVTSILTRPTEMEKLKSFYTRIRPPGPGWRHVRAQIDDVQLSDPPLRLAAIWLSTVLFLVGALVAPLDFIRGQGAPFIWAVVSILGLVAMIALQRGSRIYESQGTSTDSN